MCGRSDLLQIGAGGWKTRVKGGEGTGGRWVLGVVCRVVRRSEEQIATKVEEVAREEKEVSCAQAGSGLDGVVRVSNGCATVWGWIWV